MKLNLTIATIALILPTAIFAQKKKNVTKSEYPNTFSSGSANISPFTQEAKRFNDWSISAGIGMPLMQSADLTSIKNGNGKYLFGYSAYLSVDKAITHAFGLKLQYDKGETKQGWYNIKDAMPAPTTPSGLNQVAAKTQFDAISLLGDINFSNLLRRVDNKSTFKWALHGYGGVGLLAYKAYQRGPITGGDEKLMTEIKPFNIGSMFAQAGAGVKYKVNRRIDVEGRVMYLISGDDSFDGGGEKYSNVNLTEEQVSDNLFNLSLGVTLKLGSHESHLFWHDPLQEIYYKLDVLANKNQDIEVCKTGDKDDDGVCDDWDRQLDTPKGARVDGAGVALDTDLDGVIDLYDKCVTVPGPKENDGCPVVAPEKPKAGQVDEINKNFEGIEFELNSDKIRPVSYGKLDNAADIIKSLSPSDKYLVVGATDTRGSAAYNLKLSQRRAASVVRYLEGKGVSKNMLIPEGRGKTDLKYPECDPATKCPEWKNEANRRVFFEQKN